MSIKTGKKLGFFAALTMLIGSVVGIGIFFKSHGILRSNDWNGTGTLLAWIIGGLLSLAAAISFSEMGSIKTGKVSGLPAYTEKLLGKKWGYLARFNYSFFYLGALVVALGFFGSEILIGTFASLTGKFNVSDVPLWGHGLIALAIVAFFLFMNIISIKASGIFAQVSVVLKWIPLVAVAVLGIALATTNNHPAKDSDEMAFGHNAFSNGHSFNFVGLLAALPAVLFAYDSFLNVLSMKDKIQGGTDRLPKIVLTGMVSVIILYSLIAISAILHGSGMVSGAPIGKSPEVGLGIFDQIFGVDAAHIVGKIVIVFLAVSTLGVVNGVGAGAVVAFEQSVHTNTIFGAKTLKAKFGERKALYIMTLVIVLFWAIFEYVPTAVLKTDGFVDGMSNFPTLFMFAVYATIILAYTLKRDKLDNKKINNVLYKTFAWIAIVGIIFVVGYQLVYGFFINAILHPEQTTHWGLYIGDNGKDSTAFPRLELGGKVTLAEGSIIMFSMLAGFVGLPFLNKYLTKKFESNDVIVNTQD